MRDMITASFGAVLCSVLAVVYGANVGNSDSLLGTIGFIAGCGFFGAGAIANVYGIVQAMRDRS